MVREQAEPKNTRRAWYPHVVLLIVGASGWWGWQTWAGQQKPEAKSAEQRATRPCAVTLLNGVTVELVGICSSPAAGGQWRTPGGVSLLKGPCEGWSSSYARQWAEAGRSGPWYEVVVRLSHPDSEKADIEWQFTEGSQTYLDIDHRPGPGLRSVFVGNYANAESIDFQAAMAAGPWKTDCVYTRKQQSVDFDARELADHTVIWERPTKPEANRPGKLKLSVIHDYRGDYEVQVLAMGVHGESVPSLQTNGNRANKLTIWRGYYDVDANDIAEFRLQVRPLHWVQFKNVSLRPGHSTQPTAERASAPRYGQP